MSAATDEWFADEEFWATTYPFMFPESRVAAAADEVEQLLALAGLGGGAGAAGAAVLDLACGPGRHSVQLARRGFAVTGVDRSAFLLGRARARAAEAGAAVEWVQSDMRDFVRPAAYDLALSLFTSFGFFRDDADNQRVLDNVAASLRPGGTFALDVAGKEVLARIFNPTASREIPDGLIVHRRSVVDGWSRMQNEWILLRGGAARTFRFGHWIYSGREIEWMFRRAGFTAVRLCGDFLGAPYGPEASRLVVVGRTGAAGDV
jgi:SAM-dependent methyltransferase